MSINPQDIWKTLKEMVGKTLKVWFFIALICSFLIFGPEVVLKKLSLDMMIAKFAPFLGFLLIVSLAAIIVLFSEKLLLWISKKIRMNQYRKQLHDLTPDQKQILCQYLLKEKNTQYFSIEDGVVNGLEAIGVLYRGSNQGRLDYWAFNIQPWAKKYLAANLELITTGVPKNSDGSIIFYRAQQEEEDY